MWILNISIKRNIQYLHGTGSSYADKSEKTTMAGAEGRIGTIVAFRVARCVRREKEDHEKGDVLRSR